MEELSRQFHIGPHPDSSSNAQAHFVGYAYRSWKYGELEDHDYHRALAIGYLRFCIALERQEKPELAGKSCDVAKIEFSLWNPPVTFAKFRQEIEDPGTMNYDLPE